MSRRRITERESRGEARRQQRRPGTTTRTSVPNRGQRDAYGETFSGFDSLKLAESILSDAALHHEQNRPGYLDGLGLPGTIKSLPNAVILTRDNVRGPVIAPANIDGEMPAGKVPEIGQLRGNAPKTKLPGDTVFGNAQGKLSYGDIVERPDLSRFATTDQVQNKITAADALQQMKRKLKPSAFK